jgi:hypothetical protein
MSNPFESYRQMLDAESSRLGLERKRCYDTLFDDLANNGMVQSDTHVEESLKIEIEHIRFFVDYALSQLKNLILSHGADIQEAEMIFTKSIRAFTGAGLLRMLGLIANVRSSHKDRFAQEALRQIEGEALQRLTSLKASLSAGEI